MSLSTAGVTNIGEKLAASIVDTGGLQPLSLQYSRGRCDNRPKNDTGGANVFANFLKKFEMALCELSGARGKMIREIKPEVKNYVTLSL
jgi:hypothetical protein